MILKQKHFVMNAKSENYLTQFYKLFLSYCYKVTLYFKKKVSILC